MKSFIMNQEALMLDDELSWKIISGIFLTKNILTNRNYSIIVIDRNFSI